MFFVDTTTSSSLGSGLGVANLGLKGEKSMCLKQNHRDVSSQQRRIKYVFMTLKCCIVLRQLIELSLSLHSRQTPFRPTQRDKEEAIIIHWQQHQRVLWTHGLGECGTVTREGTD